MSRLYRVIFIFSIVAAIIGFPLTAQAEPLLTHTSATNTYTAQLSAADFSQWGVDKMLSGNYKGAMEAFTQAIRLNPGDAKAYGNRGLVHAALGEQQEAIADFNQALHLNPKLAPAYYNRGFVRLDLQDYQGALADFDQAIRLSPQDADAYHCRCLVRYKLGEDKQGVMADFHTAAALYLQQGKLEEYLGLVKAITKKLQAPHIFSLA